MSNVRQQNNGIMVYRATNILKASCVGATLASLLGVGAYYGYRAATGTGGFGTTSSTGSEGFVIPSSSVPSSLTPSFEPSLAPSLEPSLTPFLEPSSMPSLTPSLGPSWEPSWEPSLTPTLDPSSAPSSMPSLSAAPSSMPSLSLLPTLSPSSTPSLSESPSSSPSSTPSLSESPSSIPSLSPSLSPSSVPSLLPSLSLSPSISPSIYRFWDQIGEDIDGDRSGDLSGHSLSLSGNGYIVAVGAPHVYLPSKEWPYSRMSVVGQVKIYKNNGGNWVQQGQALDGKSAFDRFGGTVSLSDDGNIVAIGSSEKSGNGNPFYIRIFKFNCSRWYILGGEIRTPGNVHSVSLSADGHTIAIGTKIGGEVKTGIVRVYNYSGNSWTQIGGDIDGEAHNDISGASVSLSNEGNIVAIGAPWNDGNGRESGHVRVFNFNGNSWEKLGNDIDGESNKDISGWSISLSGDGSIVAIGAHLNDGNGIDSGHVRVYQNDGVTCTQLGDDIDGEAAEDGSGWSVSLSGDGSIVAIGALKNEGTGGKESGHVRVYKYKRNTWNKLGQDIDGERKGDVSGQSVSLSNDGSKVAIGAGRNDGNGESSGHVRVFELN